MNRDFLPIAGIPGNKSNAEHHCPACPNSSHPGTAADKNTVQSIGLMPINETEKRTEKAAANKPAQTFPFLIFRSEYRIKPVFTYADSVFQ
ncbi:MAG: hypothetical protein V8R25_00925 [Alphaproteobacteria bacterium]